MAANDHLPGMRTWHIVASRIRSLLRRGRREDDLREELQLHLEQEAERLRASGVPAEAARLEALRLFGGVEWTKDLCRDARGIGPIEALRRDVRYAVRRLLRDWRFTSAAILILGLGIGANTAMFSVVNASLLRPAHVADPDRLVDLYQNGSNPRGVDANSYPAYQDMAASSDVFESATAALVPFPVTYIDRGAVRPAIVEYVTASYPAVLGLQPAIGRWFDGSEDRPGAAVVAVIGDAAWRRTFRADPSILGRTIQIEGVPVTIVGVAPRGHRATIDVGIVTDFWLPVSAVPALTGSARILDRKPPEAAFSVKARLREGASVAQAQAAMRLLGARLAAEYPEEDPGQGIAVVASRDVRIHPQMDGLLTTVASILLTIVGLVLAIACSNLATLLLVRGAARAKEVSVRLALGASRAQLVRHLLAESLLLALAGCVAGCLLAWWAVRALAAQDLPIVFDLSLDYRVLVFAGAVSFVTGLAFGLAPALKATRVDLVPTLRGDGDAPSSDVRRITSKDALVAFQVAVSVLLLGVTTLFLQMVRASTTLPAGFVTEGVAFVQTDVRYAGYDRIASHAAIDDVRRRVAARPGVVAAAATHGPPMESSGASIFVEGATQAAGPDGATGTAGAIWAGPGYFDVLGIPVLYGRAIDERDRPDTARVALISEAMARRFFSAANPASAVGRRFRTERDVTPGGWIEVVGIVPDTGTADRNGDLVDPTPHLIYRSFVQAGLAPTTLIARTSGDAATLAGDIQRDVRAVDARLPVLTAKTMAQHLDDSLAAPRAVGTLIGVLGLLGLALAAIGLYAVVAFTVARRARDIGIRIALGARRHQAVAAIARHVAGVVAAGTAVGLTVTLLAIFSLRAATVSTPGIVVYRPAPEPLALFAVAAFVAVVALAATIIPARRAATMDPLTALRRD